MKKTMKLLAALTSVTLFSAAVVMPMNVIADEYASNAAETSYSISFIDSVTGKYVDNVNAKLYKIGYKSHLSGVLADADGFTFIDEWNSSDVSSYVTEPLSLDRIYSYVISVELPEGYIYRETDSFEYLLTYPETSTASEKTDVTFYLQRGEAKIPNTFPLKGTFSLTVNFMDYSTREKISGIGCELIDEQTNEVAAKWTSGSEPECIEGLEYEFKTRDHNVLNDKSYKLVITDMPENYRNRVVPYIYRTGIGNDLLTMHSYNCELQEYILLVNNETSSIVTGSHDTQVTTTIHSNTTTERNTYTTAAVNSTSTVCSTSEEFSSKGDANCDNRTTVADAVAILQFIGNRDKYELTEQGKKNADVDGAEGITGNDALTIQQWDAQGKLSEK